MKLFRDQSPVPELDDPSATLKELLKTKAPAISQGQEIGITIGSRGIDRMQELVKEVVAYIKSKGALAVIIPAMGSHGGATAEGQKEVLASYGITEEQVGAPIRADMETIELATDPESGLPVYFDRQASLLDGVILMNRVKAHTDFHSTYESGLMKISVIGLGNHKGAEHLHFHGLRGLKTLIPSFARTILAKGNILFGIALMENAKDTLAEIHLLTKDEIAEKEPNLLLQSKKYLPKLPVDNLDVLVVERMGKNISGVGIDPNITGRRAIRSDQDSGNASGVANRIVCLDLTPECHGNALGMGIADFIPKRFYEQIDFQKTYANVITSGFVERGFVPLVMENDFQAIDTAIQCCGRKVDDATVRLLQIQDTLSARQVLVSPTLTDEVAELSNWQDMGEVEYLFDDQGKLKTRIKSIA